MSRVSSSQVPKDTQELYNQVRNGEPHTESFEAAASKLGYREVVDIPVAVMDDWGRGGNGQMLRGRADIIAGDREGEDPPVANLISHNIDHWVLDMLKEDSRFDEYIIRLNTAKDPSLEVFDQLTMDNFFTTVNPYGLHSTLGQKKQWFLNSFWNSDLPIKPGLDLSEVLMNGAEWLNEKYSVENYVVVPPEGAGGYGIEKVDSSGVIDYVRRSENGQEIIDRFRALGHADEDYGHTTDIRVEPCLPTVGDIRAFIDADGVLSAYIRFGPEDDFRHNISQIEADNAYDRVLKVYEQERAKPFTTEGFEGLESLPEAVNDLLSDTGNYVAENLVGKPDAILLGGDVLVLEKEALEIVPEPFNDAIKSYSDENHAYVLSEMHGTGAGGQLRYLHDNLEELPVLFEYEKLHNLAGLNPSSPSEIRYQNHPLHNRIHNHYSDLKQAAHYAHESP